MSKCPKFENLRKSLEHQGSEEGLDSKQINYLINKTTNIIRKAKFDIYEVHTSFKGYKNFYGRYVSTRKISCGDKILYLSLIVD